MQEENLTEDQKKKIMVNMRRALKKDADYIEAEKMLQVVSKDEKADPEFQKKLYDTIFDKMEALFQIQLKRILRKKEKADVR